MLTDKPTDIQTDANDLLFCPMLCHINGTERMRILWNPGKVISIPNFFSVTLSIRFNWMFHTSCFDVQAITKKRLPFSFTQYNAMTVKS